jgi:hypothetical protein
VSTGVALTDVNGRGRSVLLGPDCAEKLRKPEIGSKTWNIVLGGRILENRVHRMALLRNVVLQNPSTQPRHRVFQHNLRKAAIGSPDFAAPKTNGRFSCRVQLMESDGFLLPLRVSTPEHFRIALILLKKADCAVARGLIHFLKALTGGDGDDGSAADGAGSAVLRVFA